MEVMVAASKEMSQFMSQKDPEQRRRKRKSRQKSGRMFIKQREGPQQFIEGHGLIVRVRHGELRACDKAGTERKQKKQDGENQRFQMDRFTLAAKSSADLKERIARVTLQAPKNYPGFFSSSLP